MLISQQVKLHPNRSTLAQSFSPVWSGRLALLTGAAFAVLALWLLVQMVWLLLAGPEVEPAAMPPVPRASQAAESNGAFRWELFGPATGTTQLIVPVAVSRSSLRVLGIVSGDRAYAIIADSQGREGVFRPGDELPDGSRVDRIETNRVLVVRAGRAEALELDASRAGSEGPATVSTDSGSPPPAQAVSGPTPAISAQPMFNLPQGVSIASMPQIAGPATLDGHAMSQNINIMAVPGGGFRVRPGRDSRLFAELGLQVNDVVTAVNGQTIDSEEAARALFADVLTRGEVAITVNRQGQQMTLRPDLEQVMGRLQNQ